MICRATPRQAQLEWQDSDEADRWEGSTVLPSHPAPESEAFKVPRKIETNSKIMMFGGFLFQCLVSYSVT